MIPVYGKVTYHGQPIGQGTLTFRPVRPAGDYPLRPATGVLTADGTYRLSTFKQDDGAVPGDYQVAIVSMISGPSLERPDAPEVWAVPKKYGNPVQSGLKVTIAADAQGPQRVDFDLLDCIP